MMLQPIEVEIKKINKINNDIMCVDDNSEN